MKALLFLFLSLWSVFLWGAGIPTSYMNNVAVDLVYQGRELMPDEAHDLYVSTKGRFDLSTLNPVETSDLWKNVYLKDLPEENISIEDMGVVDYNSPTLAESGTFRFNVKHSDNKIYTMMLGKTIHSILLAKSLLRKIGYQVPDVKYLPRSIIRFKNDTEKKGFLSYLEHVAFAGEPKNWVVEELDDNQLLLQDLIVTGSTHIIYNLAVGVMADMVLGRRLISSLAVPLTIVNLSESVNMLRWQAGIESNKEIQLAHNRLEDFQCTWEDARWISRRIEKLTRDDWKQIVESSNLPKAVQMILLEKLISRRNSVMKLFKVEHDFLKTDAEVGHGVDLYKGKLTKQNWPGYASRFAYGDPDSPLSVSEIKSWVKSKAISIVLDLAISALNQLPYLKWEKDITDQTKFQELVEKTVNKSVDVGTPVAIPVKGWVMPTVGGNVIVSRNLVTGTYLGTDNLVQLADTVGVSVNAGISAGLATGITSLFTGRISGDISLVRSYSHLRPVTSMEKSLKYPFKNIFVPLVKIDYGIKLHEAVLATVDPDASEDERKDKIEKALKPFKDAIDVGESLLVTDSLGTMGGVEVGGGHKVLLKASLGLVPGHVVVSRFHVHRKSTDEFQIYKDLAHNGSIGVGFELNSLIPLVKVSYKKSGGHARVKFYNLNLNPKNPKALDNAAHLREAIVSSSTGEMDQGENTKPYVLLHSFEESNPKLGFLFWQWQKINSSTAMTLTHPGGEEKYYRRQYYGSSKGRNYQAYVAEMISNWISMIFEKNIDINSGTGSNPGFSFKGSADTKFVTFDEEVDITGAMIEPFIKVTNIKNGWSINRDNANLILEDMKMRYRHEFFNAPVLNDTRQIFLYNISVNMFFYKSGIEYLFGLTEEQIKEIFRRNKAQKNLVIVPTLLDDSETGVYKFLKYMKAFRKYESWEWEKWANTSLMKAFSYAEENLTLDGLAELMGGKENVYMMARIDGFREGDEDGDRPFISSSIGEYGSPNILGPVVQMQKQTDMLEGEFFIYWMMTRLI